MDYRASDLVSILDADLLYGSGELSVDRIYIDSRKIWVGNNSCFVVLKGLNFNAHDFVSMAYGHGIRVFVVSEDRPEWKNYSDSDFILVKDTVRALQKIAIDHRNKFSFPIIGVTGSNGKTTVKEWLSQSLSSKFNVVRTPKSYNSQIGVPLSIFQMNRDHQIGVFEAGISHLNEMAFLKSIICPDIGIFTNIGNAHGEYFQSNKEKAIEKALLFDDCKAIIYCSDDELVSNILRDKKGHQLAWSENSNGLFNFEVFNDDPLNVVLSFENEKMSFMIPFSDPASRQNVFHIIVLLWHLDFSEQEINDQLKMLSHINMRLESVEGISNSLLINDVYNSDLTSLEAAIEIFKNERTKNSKHLILSDIKNTGYSPEKISELIASQVKDIKLSSVHLIGEEAKEYKGAFNGSTAHFYRDTNDFLSRSNSLMFRDSVVLIKGSRSFELERITDKFQKKTHKTVLEVNLSAILENLNFYRSKLNTGVKITVMVKAFSYGSGLYEIASLLEKNNVDYLAVAYVDEGIALREKNVGIPIIVMNPEEAELDLFMEYRLEPVIHSWGSLDHFLGAPSSLPIHIKIDTGMNRLGFIEKDIPELVKKIETNEVLVASVFTHLASSEDPIQDEFTQRQFSIFSNTIEHFPKDKNIHFHMLNTSGITRFPNFQMDMVRLGIGLYGYSAVKKDRDFLKTALTLKSTISQIKTVDKGESVGYSRGFIASKKTLVGIVPIGYADGIHRSFGNENGKVFINGRNYKVIGNICMDMCMVDLENEDHGIGDEVEFFGPNKKVEDTASEMGTIAYEVLATISQRVKRTFYFD